MSISSILRAPFNWRREARKDPAGFMAEAKIRGREMIAEQEILGQQSFAKSNTLPTDIRDGVKELLEADGVKFLNIVDDDPKFQYVELPEGWRKVPSSHSEFWTYLHDEHGVIRADIFFKAAFHAREVWMRGH